MAQYLPNFEAPLLGARVGQGLSNVLNQYTENKIQQMHKAQGQSQLARALESLPGLSINSEQARGLASLPESVLQQSLKHMYSQPANEAYAAALSSILGSPTPQQEQETVPGQQLAVQTQQGPRIPPQLNSQQALQLAQLGLKKQGTEAKLKEGEKAREQQKQQFQQKLDFEREKLQTKQAKDIEKFEKTVSVAEQREAAKETLPYYNSTLAMADAAKSSDKRLKNMEKLVEKGGLPVAGFYKLFKNLEESVPPTYGATAGALLGGGIGSVIPGAGTIAGAALGGAIGGLISPVATLLRYGQRQTSPNAEIFEKLSAEYIQNAKAIFGSRITDQDLKAFMAQIPTLENTDAGKKQIIGNMKAANKAAEVKAKTMREIIRENGGKRPADLQYLVEERAKPELDKIAAEFTATL
jgi:hypothetical protein